VDELAAIIEDRGASDRTAVLATVVHVRGSAYRRPGARMLILGDGRRIGTISGGCLESDVIRKAWWWTDGGASVRVFDNTVEDAAFDLGLGCNGVITVLLERAADSRVQEMLDFLEERRAQRGGAVVATVVATTDDGDAIGDRVLFDGSEIVAGSEGCIAGQIDEALRATYDERKSRLVHLDDADVFVEWVASPQRLFLFGGGHDAIPLANVAAMMGWSVTVADTRAAHLRPERFPEADRLFQIPASDDVSALGIGPEDAAILMTHSYPQDLALLPHLLAAQPRYLGLLGPRMRAERLFEEVGGDVSAGNVHAPIGLDIGGDRPESIALSIAAEIQAVLQDHSAAPLRHREGAIHAPAIELGRADVRRTEPTIHPECGLARA